MNVLPISTIAFSLYNVLASECGVLEMQLAIDTTRSRFAYFSDADAVAAVAGLVSRGYVSQATLEVEGTVRVTLVLVDRECRLLRKRDRTGDGWTGWSFGTQLLEEVIQCSRA